MFFGSSNGQAVMKAFADARVYVTIHSDATADHRNARVADSLLDTSRFSPGQAAKE